MKRTKILCVMSRRSSGAWEGDLAVMREDHADTR